MKNTEVVILAAGKGTRMNSDLPKVLHKICGKPLLYHVLGNVKEVFSAPPYIVIGYQAEKVKAAFKQYPAVFVLQEEQLGTGHAVLQTESFLRDKESTVMVLNGDMPLINSRIISDLMMHHLRNGASATVLTVKMDDPKGYGRIVRGRTGHLEKIVEQKDASLGELEINEINTGTYCFKSRDLFAALHEVRSENVQHEYYLTDIIAILRKQKKKVSAFLIDDPLSAIGINTKEQLAEAEKIFKSRCGFCVL
ncbi:MAG: sugar phosphate nucleotidyltransferase [Candidatus Margulisiibacteriota bacterium]